MLLARLQSHTVAGITLSINGNTDYLGIVIDWSV